ncbi:MAG TPA: flagellar biosynthesis protein FlhF [Rhodocyclaceae bacterium]|nr:flagellar biosynthesis protein FlhF [Rhodocyclaceae bacterium]
MVNVKKFVGKTSREALALLKAELGSDAVVLSNRSVPEGVEIVAMPADSMGELNATVRQANMPKTSSQPAGGDDDFTVTLGQHIAKLARDQSSQPQSGKPRFHSGLDRNATRHDANKPGGKATNATAKTPPVVRPFQPPHVETSASETQQDVPEYADDIGAPEMDAKIIALEATNMRLMDELASIKGMLERQLAGFAWSEMTRNAPARTQMMGELLEAGFSPQLTRKLTESLSADVPVTEARSHVRELLNEKLRIISTDADIIDRGGVFALVGPTGVGKTTTTAKLAARCVVRHGADKIALITTDVYRIGAHEQLRIYGRILGVQVHVVRDGADLRQTLQDLRHKHMVLIDTIGMSHRDKMVMDQAAMLSAAGNVKRLLLLNATARGDTLDDVIRAYKHSDLAGCILTKVDETASLAPALDVAVRNDLDVFYIANGQRVPEDLHLPNRSYVVHRALRELPADSPHKLDTAEAGFVIAASKSATRNPLVPPPPSSPQRRAGDVR